MCVGFESQRSLRSSVNGTRNQPGPERRPCRPSGRWSVGPHMAADPHRAWQGCRDNPTSRTLGPCATQQGNTGSKRECSCQCQRPRSEFWQIARTSSSEPVAAFYLHFQGCSIEHLHRFCCARPVSSLYEHFQRSFAFPTCS
jgi:hypothetical protein